jgi:hypothetical protein
MRIAQEKCSTTEDGTNSADHTAARFVISTFAFQAALYGIWKRREHLFMPIASMKLTRPLLYWAAVLAPAGLASIIPHVPQAQEPLVADSLTPLPLVIWHGLGDK